MIPDDDLAPILIEHDDLSSDHLATIILSHLPWWARVLYRVAFAYLFVLSGVKAHCDADGDIEVFDGMPA